MRIYTVVATTIVGLLKKRLDSVIYATKVALTAVTVFTINMMTDY